MIAVASKAVVGVAVLLCRGCVGVVSGFVSEVGSSLCCMAGDVHLADGTGATGAGGSARARELAEQIRAESTAIAAAEARRLRLLGRFLDEVALEAGAMLSPEGRAPAAPRELVESAVLGEVQAVLGVPEGRWTTGC